MAGNLATNVALVEFRARFLFQLLLETIGGDPIFEGSALVGLILEDKSTITLEMSGAIEYSSRPEQTLTECLALAKRRLVDVARVAERRTGDVRLGSGPGHLLVGRQYGPGLGSGGVARRPSIGARGPCGRSAT